MGLSSRNKVSVSFSMSGMTDIVFLLLIFFMLTSTLVNQNALKLLLPKSSNQTQASPQVTVSITSDLSYYYEDKKIGLGQLETSLVKELKNRVEPTISINADKSVPIEYVVNVMNIAKRNKYKVILATSQE